MSNIKVFEDKKIRTQWNEQEEDWYFSVVDIVGILTDKEYDDARKYWKVLKGRLKNEGSELVSFCYQLKLPAQDGKLRETDVLNTKGILRLVQSITSKKAEPFKMWLASCGSERLDEIAKEVLEGKWGNGADRQNRLAAAGYNYNQVQAKVNELSSKKTAPTKSIDEVAREVLNGQWGNGADRQARLSAAGYNYAQVQARVNQLAAPPKKSIDEIAREVIAGKWGNGADRQNRLTAAGYNYAQVQARVNQLL